MLISVILIYITIRNNKNLNQKIIFNEIVKQERELRIKLNEYRKEIHIRMSKSKKKEDWTDITLDYDTLLFNYYEFLAICLYKKLINEREAQLYFKESVKAVRDLFDSSILFEEGYANREQYKGIQWLFKKWKI